MAKYIIKRVFMLIPILIGVTLLVFILLSFTPGDTARLVLGSTATEEQLEMFREEHGLNDPLLVQYAEYMLGVVRGNLGTSYATRQAVSDMIGARVGYTLALSFISMFLTILISLPLGVLMAVKQNSPFDNFMRVASLIFTSMPEFWLGLMMILLFAVKLGWLPSSGLDNAAGYVMPVLCLALGGITMCSRTGRSSMLEVIHQDYIRTARAKGLRYGYIIRHHALKNALLPMVSTYGRIVATCFSGSVVLESVFGINGIGSMMTAALRQKDTPTIMGSIIISACVITLVNLVTDLAYAFIDPRIKSKYVGRKAKSGKKVTANES